MRQPRRFFAYTAALPLLATFLWMAIPGCSGENTVVAEGDPVARRKHKDDALNKVLNPTGVPAPAAKAKGKPSRALAHSKRRCRGRNAPSLIGPRRFSSGNRRRHLSTGR